MTVELIKKPQILRRVANNRIPRNIREREAKLLVGSDLLEETILRHQVSKHSVRRRSYLSEVRK